MDRNRRGDGLNRRSIMPDRRTGGVGRLVASGLAAVCLVVTALAATATAAGRQPSKMDTSPLSGSVLMARALRSGAVELSGSGRSIATAPGSPSLTVLPNVKASTGSQPANETPISANPSNGSQLMTGANDYNCSSLQGFYNSDNGGATWRQHCMPVTGAGGCGDPNVGYDLNNTGYILGIGNCNGSTGSIVFQTTTNNGISWTAAQTAFGSLLGGIADKPWTEIDTNLGSPFANCLYTSWTDFDASFTQSRASVAHSCNGGATWTRIPVDTTRTVPQVDQFTDLAIGSDGTVYLTWLFCKTSGPAGTCGNTSVDMKFSKSTDGGNTWSPAIVMATAQVSPDTCGGYYGCVPGTNERLSNIPVIDIDKVDGSLHVAYYTYTGGQTRGREIHSTNGGTTWSAPVQFVGLNANVSWPWLAVSPTGTVGIGFFVSRNTSYAEAAAFSTNGGVSWPTVAKVSSVLANFNNDGFGGTFIGDYTGGIWTGGTLHTSWSDARTSPSVDMTGGATP
jgi:hypothetical protein